MTKLITTTLLLLLLAGASAAAPPLPRPQQATTVPAVTPQDSQDAALAVLKAELAAEKEHNGKIQDTVYWALSFVGGLTLLLVGASWFNARVVHERDIKSIQRLLSSEQAENINQVKQQLTSEVNALLEAEFSRRLTTETRDLRRSVKAAAEAAESLKQDLKILEHTTEIRYWEDQDVPANVLMHYRLMLEDVKSFGDEYRIAEALGGIQKLLQTGARIEADEVPEFISAMRDLPDHFSVNVQAIRHMLVGRRPR